LLRETTDGQKSFRETKKKKKLIKMKERKKLAKEISSDERKKSTSLSIYNKHNERF